MQNLIDEILQDLYKLDPDLMKKEQKIKSLIEEMISSKPAVQIDETFKNQLKNLILQEISSSKKVVKNKQNNNFLTNIWFAVWGLAVWIWSFALVFNMYISPWFWQNTDYWTNKIFKWKDSSQNNDLKLSFETKINRLEDKAFGDITTIEKNSSWWTTWQVQSGITVGNSFEVQPSRESSQAPLDIQLDQLVEVVDKNIEQIDGDVNSAKLALNPEKSTNIPPQNTIHTDSVQSDEDELSLTITSDEKTKSEKVSSKAVGKWWSSMVEDIYTPTVYKYIYSWKKIEIKESQLPVYKKVKIWFDDKDFINIIKNIDIGKLDMSKFTNLKMNNISVSEDREFWFDISINFKEWNMYFYKNFEKWPVNCIDMMKLSSSSSYHQNCTNYKITISDIPDDTKLLEIVNDFIKQYSIDTKDFGQPVIDNYWKIWYENSTDKANYYLPDTINVIYPWIIDGNEIYEEFWQKKWLKIWVDVKNLKVNSLNSMEKMQFDVSNYDIDQNFENIIKVAEKWWRYWFTNDSYSDSFKVVNLTLLEPEIKYIDYYTYKDYSSQEYLIPSYVFPVDKSNIRLDEYVPNTVIVPLTKDFYIYDEAGNIVWIKQ